MGKEKLVTLQVDVSTRELLRQIAMENMRSMTSQVQWMVYQEWLRIFGDSAEAVRGGAVAVRESQG